jgi:SAM-dependent methyltransferase
VTSPPSEPVETARFAFGENWRSFVAHVSPSRVRVSVQSLDGLAGPGNVTGRSFLDVGSGSGLSSLAAASLGAARIHSFDFDAQSVAATGELKDRFFPDASYWTVEQGSVLDRAYLASLREWDVVYSWGVLHHTGRMWEAVENLFPLVKPGALLIIALYNDQGWQSRAWTRVKALYNRGRIGRAVVTALGIPAFFGATLAADLARARNPLARYRTVERGMSPLHDWFDWLGGYPFEVATRSAVVTLAEQHGFVLERLRDVGGRLGCNEFVFRRRC